MGAVTEFKEVYMKNCDKSWELDEALMQEKSFVEWKEILIRRSTAIRDMFRENEELFQRVADVVKDGVADRALAEELYAALEDMYYGGYDDLYVMETMAKPLIAYYAGLNDTERQIFLYHMLGFENFEFYERILGDRGISDSIACYERVISWREHYAEIKSPRIRKCFFSAYNNLIAPIGQVNGVMMGRVFEFYEAAMELWRSDTVQRLDGEDEEFAGCIRQIRDDILFTEDYAIKMPEDFQRKFVEVTKQIQEYNVEHDVPDGEGTMLRADIKRRLLMGEETRLLLDELSDHIQKLELPDYDGDEWTCMLRIMDYHNSACSVFDLLEYGKIPKEEQRRYTEVIIPLVTNIHMRIPFGFWTTVMSNMCAEWFKEARPYLDDVAEKRKLLLKLIISRQPITYIHSLMVSEIATRIAATLIKEQPAFFAGVLGSADEGEVTARHNQILDFVAECAILHDVGKCELSEVINRQSRRLSDNEFAVIKYHPAKALELLDNDEDFAPYYDVMRGHHRSYDGKKGYPQDFDNTVSPIKPVIDLIMVSDCIDAATDMLGRNYAKGKNFERLYGELQAGAGTMYNPQIVDLIGRNEILFHDLEYLTEFGRQEIYYRAYKEIITR